MSDQPKPGHKSDQPRWSVPRFSGYRGKVYANTTGEYVDYTPPSATPPQGTKVIWRTGSQIYPPPVKGTVTSGGFKRPTPWGSHVSKVFVTPYDYEYTLFGKRYRTIGDCLSAAQTGTILDPVPDLSTDSNVNVSPNITLRSRCRVEALNKINDKKFDMGVALAESRQTARHLTSVVTRLYGSYKAARSGRWERARKILGVNGKSWKEQSSNASSAWLEYSYAWVPLFSDIFGLQEQLKEGFKENDQLFSVVRHAKESVDPRNLLSPSSYRSNPTLLVTTRKSEIFFKTKYYCRVENSSLLALSSLGLTNPIGIAWELVPFSFVVDWVLPIGDFLNALVAIEGVEFVSGHESYGSSYDFDLTWPVGGFFGNFAYPYAQIVKGTPPLITVQRHTTKRDVLTYWGLSGVRPYTKDPFSLAHAATTAALFRKLH